MAKGFFKKESYNMGLLQFAIRSLIFGGLLFGTYLFIFLFFRHTPFFLKYLDIADEYYFLSGLRRTDFLNSALFSLVIFFIWNRKEIKSLKPYSQEWIKTGIFLFLSMLSLFAHYFFKFWISVHSDTISNTLGISLLKYSLIMLFVFFLMLAVYGTRFLKEETLKFWKQGPFFLVLIFVYFYLIQFFQEVWFVLGNFVANSLAFLLGVSFNNVFLKIVPPSAISLGAEHFVVSISKECSGIDSLLLFLSLYIVLFALDYKIMHKLRMLALLIPGILWTISYNILRLYLLMLVGIYISPTFAVDMFHTNIGWILFLVFFVVFWSVGSKWVYKKSPQAPKETQHTGTKSDKHR